MTSDCDKAIPDKAQPLFEAYNPGNAGVALGQVFKCTESPDTYRTFVYRKIVIHMFHIQTGKDLSGRMGESVQILMRKNCGNLPKKT